MSTLARVLAGAVLGASLAGIFIALCLLLADLMCKP
jgi:hypothetical protein